MPSQTCPILGRETQFDVVGRFRDEWILARCCETGLVFLANPPPYAELADELAWEKTFLAERSRRRRQEPIVAQVSRLANAAKRALAGYRNKLLGILLSLDIPNRPLRVLDIGCGKGRLMMDVCRHFREADRQVIPLGIEISRQLAEMSNQRLAEFGGRVILANGVEGVSRFSHGEIDVAIMSSYLEHEREPLELLLRLRPALAPKGTIILKVPNYGCWNRRLRGKQWCGFRFPDHVNYFTPRTLNILAQRAGFRVARQNLLDRFPLSDSMYAVLKPAASAA